ncbi:hypothetical protein ABW19_dt0202816 [Dactylella cylindrospora]|nr:hypothetical protein ABW19_dt0202816 [Dactylella cylindrospora]
MQPWRLRLVGSADSLPKGGSPDWNDLKRPEKLDAGFSHIGNNDIVTIQESLSGTYIKSARGEYGIEREQQEDLEDVIEEFSRRPLMYAAL